MALIEPGGVTGRVSTVELSTAGNSGPCQTQKGGAMTTRTKSALLATLALAAYWVAFIWMVQG